jgi:hypothetical protein
MMKKKRCSKCYKIKDRSEFYKNKGNKDGLMYYCSVCDAKRLRGSNKIEDKKLEARFLYGEGDVLKNKQYMKDRAEMFQGSGNGWWWKVEDRSHRRLKRGKYKKRRFAGKFAKE